MRNVLRRLILVILVVVVLFNLGGGWYFSDQLRADALAPGEDEAALDLVVTAVGEGTLTLRPVADPVADLSRPGLIGVDWESGFGQLGDPVTFEADGSVTRPMRILEGTAPTSGLLSSLDVSAFPGDPQRAFGLAFVEVSYQSPLGPMTAWLVPATSTTWVIHIHGKGATRAEALRLVDPIAEAGFPQLVISYRNDAGMPTDPSGYYRYGSTEWEDVKGAVDFAFAEGADRVVLVGYSTGAALALAYLYQVQGVPVVGAVFDSPNIDFSATVDLGASQRRLPGLGIPLPGTLVWAAKQISALRFGVDWGVIDYVSKADLLRVPVLVIHGPEDTTVPFSTSERFAAARPELVTLVPVIGAEHVRSWNVNPDGYERRVVEFIDRL